MMIFNILGAVMLIRGLVLAFVTGGLIELIWPNSGKEVAAGGLVFFLTVVPADLVYRWRNHRERGLLRFIHPITGGMFFFLPIWVFCGLVPICVNVYFVVAKLFT